MNKRIVIIGGNAAGASAAGKAARFDKSAEITLIEKSPYISIATCGLPYYIGKQVKDRKDLIVRTPDQLRGKYGIKILTETEALKINRPAKTVRVFDQNENRKKDIEYDELILAPGADSLSPPIRNINAPNVFKLRTLPDADVILHFIENREPQRAVVIGGGYIGIEAAESLQKLDIKTTLIEMVPQVLPPLDPEMAKHVEKEMKEKGVQVVTDDAVEAMETDRDGFVAKVITKSGKDFETDMVLVSAGVRPNLALAEDAGLKIGKYGIETDDYMRTSDPHIYAAGDVVQVKHMVSGNPAWSPLAGPANLQGKIAGANAVGANERYKGLLKTSIVQFGDIAAARTGLTEKEAVSEGLDFVKTEITSTANAGYMGKKNPLWLKLLARKNTGHIIGAQAVGAKGVDKRIDVLSTAIYAKLTVDDLEHLDLAYSPQFSHSLDPVNVLGSVMQKRIQEVEKV